MFKYSAKDLLIPKFAKLAFVLAIAAVSVAAQTGGIKGRVRSTRGNGISAASVTARQNGADIKSARTDAKGDFVLNGLKSGIYNVVFDAKGYSTGVKYNVEIRQNKISDLGDRLVLTSDQGSQVIVKGSVFFKDGTSITGAEVVIERVNADGSFKKIGSTETTISGEFTLRQPEGAAKLRITAKYKGVIGTKDVEVSDAAIYRIAISLDINRENK